MRTDKRTTLTERLRWKIVNLLERRVPRQCWADLVGWAIDGPQRDNVWPWQPQGYSCRKDFTETGACYCGKLRTPDEDPPALGLVSSPDGDGGAA